MAVLAFGEFAVVSIVICIAVRRMIKLAAAIIEGRSTIFARLTPILFRAGGRPGGRTGGRTDGFS